MKKFTNISKYFFFPLFHTYIITLTRKKNISCIIKQGRFLFKFFELEFLTSRCSLSINA